MYSKVDFGYGYGDRDASFPSPASFSPATTNASFTPMGGSYGFENNQYAMTPDRIYAYRPTIPPTPEETSEHLLDKLEQAGRVPSKEKFRRMVCNTFIFTGACPYNDRCVFLHDFRIKAEGMKVRTTRQNKANAANKDTFYWPDMTRKDVLRNMDGQGLPTANQIYVIPEAFKNNPANFHNRGLYSLWAHFVEFCIHNNVFYTRKQRDLSSETFFQISGYKENPHVTGAKRLDVLIHLSLGKPVRQERRLPSTEFGPDMELLPKTYISTRKTWSGQELESGIAKTFDEWNGDASNPLVSMEQNTLIPQPLRSTVGQNGHADTLLKPTSRRRASVPINFQVLPAYSATSMDHEEEFGFDSYLNMQTLTEDMYETSTNVRNTTNDHNYWGNKFDEDNNVHDTGIVGLNDHLSSDMVHEGLDTSTSTIHTAVPWFEGDQMEDEKDAITFGSWSPLEKPVVSSSIGTSANNSVVTWWDAKQGFGTFNQLELHPSSSSLDWLEHSDNTMFTN